MNVDELLTYLDFVVERHRIWEQRQAGEPQPWTEDPILASRKFTNVFRVLDPGSQFVFELTGQDPVNDLMRLFLYRHTGRVEAWRWLRTELLGWPTIDDLPGLFDLWNPYRGEQTVVLKNQTRQPGTRGTGYQKTKSQRPIFTNAYLVFPQSAERGTDKLRSIIDLTRRLADNGTFADFLTADSQIERFHCLRRNKGVADFMSMQILTDWGYTRWADGDREDEFVQPGPGAVRGAAILDPAQAATATLRRCQQELHALATCPELPVVVSEHGRISRLPSLMDVQNTLCEYSKYVRYRDSASPGGRPYVPVHPGAQATPMLPAHWH